MLTRRKSLFSGSFVVKPRTIQANHSSYHRDESLRSISGFMEYIAGLSRASSPPDDIKTLVRNSMFHASGISPEKTVQLLSSFAAIGMYSELGVS
jgi:hypothetical protein